MDVGGVKCRLWGLRPAVLSLNTSSSISCSMTLSKSHNLSESGVLSANLNCCEG